MALNFDLDGGIHALMESVAQELRLRWATSLSFIDIDIPPCVSLILMEEGYLIHCLVGAWGFEPQTLTASR